MEDQIDFKSSAKTFVRTYNFLSAILPYGSIQWEKLSIFLTLLLPKLPKPEGEDYTEGLLEDVDLESYRAEAQETMRIQLENENGEIAPVPVSTSTGIDVPELDSLTNILKEFMIFSATSNGQTKIKLRSRSTILLKASAKMNDITMLCNTPTSRMLVTKVTVRPMKLY